MVQLGKGRIQMILILILLLVFLGGFFCCLLTFTNSSCSILSMPAMTLHICPVHWVNLGTDLCFVSQQNFLLIKAGEYWGQHVRGMNQAPSQDQSTWSHLVTDTPSVVVPRLPKDPLQLAVNNSWQVFITKNLDHELAHLGFGVYCSSHLKCLSCVVAFCTSCNPSVLFHQGQIERAFDCH